MAQPKQNVKGRGRGSRGKRAAVRSPVASPVRRVEILNASLSLFATRGFNATAIPLIAELAGVAAGTIYLHFDNKEALVNELYRTWKGAFLLALTDQYPEAASVHAKFLHLWNRMTAFARENPLAFQFLETHYHGAYLDAVSRKLEDQVMDVARAFARDGKQSGELKPIQDELLIALVFGAFVHVQRESLAGRLQLTPELLDCAAACCWDSISRPTR